MIDPRARAALERALLNPRELATTRTAVERCLREDRVSPALASMIERVHGIPRHEMRPDLWDAPVEMVVA